MTDPLLDARHLTRRHPDGERWLLDDVSLSLRPGDRVCVEGPSGSGKTLLLRAMVMLDPLDRGEVRWQGETVARQRIPSLRRQVMYMHQRPVLTGATVEAALREPYGLAVHRGASFDRNRVLAMLRRLGREAGFLDKSPADLSGGEGQIAALVRALQLEPSVLLLDEPTAALDPAATEAVEGFLARWAEAADGARAMVWVSHDAAQTRRVGDRVLRMAAGRLHP